VKGGKKKKGRSEEEREKEKETEEGITSSCVLEVGAGRDVLPEGRRVDEFQKDWSRCCRSFCRSHCDL
jgi:hypothetical protein